MQIERVDTGRCLVGESPLWCARNAVWYWVDIPAKLIWRLDPSSGNTRSWSTDEMVACIALTETGNLIAGMETGIFHLTLGDGRDAAARLLASPAELGAGMRFNDGRCDRQGRFWSGTMLLDMAAGSPVGQLYRYDADGLSAPVVSGLIVQNGLAWSPDGRTMYLSDAHVSRRLIWAFDYDTERGIPGAQRLLVDMKNHPGRPDGAAVDVDGCYWICANDGACVLRFTPEGKLDRSITLPMKKPSMCSFGGPGLDTLLITSIGAGAGHDDEWAGAVLMLRPGVCGFADTRFPD